MTLYYRVHLWEPGAKPGAPYSAEFIPPQGYGRWDNPDLYRLRYLATSPEGAIAETFGSHATWTPAMLHAELKPDRTRALTVFEAAENPKLAELADPQTLLQYGVRVTDVVRRELRVTQLLAARLYDSGDYEGISWWSFYHPSISLVALFQPDSLRVVDTVPLSIDSAEMRAAASLIVREITPN